MQFANDFFPAMSPEELGMHLERMADNEFELRQAGQAEYARNSDNAFANFNRVAEWLGITPEQAAMTYLLKHIDGITAHVNGNESQRESVHGRIADARVYLGILDAMITAREGPATDEAVYLKGYRDVEVSLTPIEAIKSGETVSFELTYPSITKLADLEWTQPFSFSVRTEERTDEGQER